ncbi:hypothetical protein L6164_015172 [Bauhinia variegata]|uniref:Uncharacterized protein n=1 Tax=Bauhinia variegata TaxID=167791 RepID=A0ACB9NNG2_BAUVA|nr:hypothetical protein L6164_015172 [Bauhinia variegata]
MATKVTVTATATARGSQAPPLSTETSAPPRQQPVSVKPETPFSDSRDVSRAATASTTLRLLETPPSSDASVILVPSHSRWFSWNDIHECEVRYLPEFFDSGSPSKNPRVYKYYRNSIVKQFRDNPSRKVTFTDVRKTLVGDVGSIRRVFDFLEAWGLINYQPASALSKPFKWEDKDSKPGGPTESASNSIESSAPIRDTSKRICSGCKAVCTIACFTCDKYDLTLCARCYVRGNYRVGVNSSDFRRVEISEETKTNWTDKETLHLVEAIMHYGDDWRRVAQHVGGRSEKECVAHFIKLPFGEELLQHQDSVASHERGSQSEEYAEQYRLENIGSGEPSKRMRLTPLADASNPIMAQAAFLSALAGVEVAQAAAQAAVTALPKVYNETRINYGSHSSNTMLQDADITSNGVTTSDKFEGACLNANAKIEKEVSEVEKAISGIIEVQMKKIQDKLVHFGDLDLLMYKEWQQLEQMSNMFFVDQLTLVFQRRSATKSGECIEENVKKD